MTVGELVRVGVDVIVGVRVIVCVAVRVGVVDDVLVALAVDVAVAVGVRVGVNVGVRVAVLVLVRVGVFVNVGVGDGVGPHPSAHVELMAKRIPHMNAIWPQNCAQVVMVTGSMHIGTGSSVHDSHAQHPRTGVPVLVGVAVAVGVAVRVGDGPVAVEVGVDVLVGVGELPVGEAVGVAVSLGVGVGPVGVEVTVAELVGVGDGAAQPNAQLDAELKRKEPHMKIGCKQKSSQVSCVTGSMQTGLGGDTQLEHAQQPFTVVGVADTVAVAVRDGVGVLV